MFIKVPNHRVGDLDFKGFVGYVFDHSPLIATRSLMRRASKAVDAIEAGIARGDTVIEVNDEVGAFFRDCVAETPIPRLHACNIVNGKQVGESVPVPARFYVPFFEAFETMTEKRPEEPVADAPVATAAE